MYTNVKVIDARSVAGELFCEFWELPMVVIKTTKGEFIDYGKNISQWRSAIGKSVNVSTELCWRTQRHTWVHLESTS